jgi:Ala-tRNA(Pro) deacylase
MMIPKRVKHYLKAQDVAFERIAHEATGSTHETALAAHVDEGRVAKAVMVHDSRGHAMAVIPGDTWLNVDALNHETGRRFELDGEAALGELFPDCQPGAVPITGPAYGIETYVDDALTTLGRVYFEAGDHRHLLQGNAEGFGKLTQGLRHGHFGDHH